MAPKICGLKGRSCDHPVATPTGAHSDVAPTSLEQELCRVGDMAQRCWPAPTGVMPSTLQGLKTALLHSLAPG